MLPSLLVVLTSQLEPIREAGVRCLKALMINCIDEGCTPYMMLGHYLVDKADEITADADYLKQVTIFLNNRKLCTLRVCYVTITDIYILYFNDSVEINI